MDLNRDDYPPPPHDHGTGIVLYCPDHCLSIGQLPTDQSPQHRFLMTNQHYKGIYTFLLDIILSYFSCPSANSLSREVVLAHSV